MQYPPTRTPGDVQKLQAESNQIRNQQFTLATVGIAAVALSSWLVPASPASWNDGAPYAAVTLFLFVPKHLLDEMR